MLFQWVEKSVMALKHYTQTFAIPFISFLLLHVLSSPMQFNVDKNEMNERISSQNPH